MYVLMRKSVQAVALLLAAFVLQSFTIVIDAGHGGKDPGCLGKKGGKEKNINLAVAKAVVLAHGGKISCQSPDGKSFVVFIEL